LAAFWTCSALSKAEWDLGKFLAQVLSLAVHGGTAKKALRKAAPSPEKRLLNITFNVRGVHSRPGSSEAPLAKLTGP